MRKLGSPSFLIAFKKSFAKVWLQIRALILNYKPKSGAGPGPLPKRSTTTTALARLPPHNV